MLCDVHFAPGLHQDQLRKFAASAVSDADGSFTLFPRLSLNQSNAEISRSRAVNAPGLECDVDNAAQYLRVGGWVGAQTRYHKLDVVPSCTIVPLNKTTTVSWMRSLLLSRYHTSPAERFCLTCESPRERLPRLRSTSRALPEEKQEEALLRCGLISGSLEPRMNPDEPRGCDPQKVYTFKAQLHDMNSNQPLRWMMFVRAKQD